MVTKTKQTDLSDNDAALLTLIPEISFMSSRDTCPFTFSEVLLLLLPGPSGMGIILTGFFSPALSLSRPGPPPSAPLWNATPSISRCQSVVRLLLIKSVGFEKYIETGVFTGSSHSSNVSWQFYKLNNILLKRFPFTSCKYHSKI